jgi:phosphatidylglycerophosphatase A
LSRRLAITVATWFGCGYSPIGPGTAGSLGAILVAWALHELAGWPPIWFAGLALALAGPGIWAADVTAKASGCKDPGLVVVDEVVGQWLTLAAAPTFQLIPVLCAFFLFRLLDIWKPFPARQLEALQGGWGIMADDVMAGAYGALVLWLLGYWRLL